MDASRQSCRLTQVSFLVTLRVPSPAAQGLAALTTTHDPRWLLRFAKPVTQKGCRRATIRPSLGFHRHVSLSRELVTCVRRKQRHHVHAPNTPTM